MNPVKSDLGLNASKGDVYVHLVIINISTLWSDAVSAMRMEIVLTLKFRHACQMLSV